MRMEYVRLCLKEREEIYRLQREGVAKNAIARALHRSDRAILDELKRCAGDPLGYLPDRAQAHADAQASKRRESPDSLRAAQLAHLHEQLKLDYSPEQIAGRLKLKKSSLYCCHETLYKMAYAPNGRALGLPALMPLRHRKRKPRKARKVKAGGITHATSIHQRPQHINDRASFGHWEGDGVAFKTGHRPNVTTLVERQTRFVCMRYNADRTTGAVMPAIIDGLRGFPLLARLSITFDRGTEFASHRKLNTSIAMQTFFCDPHSPWQKGGNENFNGRLRRFLPKGKIPRELSQESLDRLATKMNNTPRKCLGYKTPDEAFQQLAFPKQLRKNCVRS
jgi:IS30 family transposase